ncbi:MAG: tryptophan--tRNA ligase [Candidatus Saccharimonadaceae bacterium]
MNTDQKTLLTGIKPTGTPHVGNFLGAIKPAIEMVHDYEHSFLFIADYHALNTVQDGLRLHDLTLSIAATWLACGLDPSKTILYRQSAVPEVFELETIINAITPKGWMNKAHAYKAALDINAAQGRDRDEGISMGLYTYPILMAADILLYSANAIPVGKDQQQHVEIARDIALRFNHTFNADVFTLPESFIQEELESVPGVDGRKMSKSYDNTIPLFATSEEWKKAINRIPTDSTSVEEPKDLSNCVIFDIFKSLAPAEQTEALRIRLEAGGIGWGEVKAQLLEVLEAQFGEYRNRYNELMQSPDEIERILAEGAQKAHAIARTKLDQVRTAIGA